MRLAALFMLALSALCAVALFHLVGVNLADYNADQRQLLNMFAAALFCVMLAGPALAALLFYEYARQVPAKVNRSRAYRRSPR